MVPVVIVGTRKISTRYECEPYYMSRIRAHIRWRRLRWAGGAEAPCCQRTPKTGEDHARSGKGGRGALWGRMPCKHDKNGGPYISSANTDGICICSINMICIALDCMGGTER